MKRISRIFVLFFCLHLNAADLIKQEIRYKCENASEVYLVWGLNNWQCPVGQKLPEGSYIKDKLFYSRMKRSSGNIFTLSLDINKGSVIDFVFWISKGPLSKNCDLWDTNPQERDYHVLAHPGIISQIDSKISVRPKESISILDFIYSLSIIAFLLLALYSFYYYRKNRIFLSVGKENAIVATSIALLLLLLLLRTSTAGKSWEIFFSPFTHFAEIFWLGLNDVIFVIIFASLFLLFHFLSRNYPRIQNSGFILFSLLSLIFLIAGALNVKIVELLGKPLNYQWLYYSGFLKSQDAKAAISVNADLDYVLRIVFLVLFFFILVRTFGILIHYFSVNKKIKYSLLFLSSILLLFYFLIAPNKVRNIDENRLSNPVSVFLASVNPFNSNPELFTMQIPDSLKFQSDPKGESSPPKSRFPHIKNVVVFVFESSPAQYFPAYGSGLNVTPVLQEHAAHSIVFENFYAHAPATNLSMVSMLTSIYPMLSYKSITEEHPEIKIPDLSQVLNSKGYRTAFFNSADNRFQRAGEFLSCRKFDCISDCKDKSCANNNFIVENKKWNFMDGRNDLCTAEQLCNWIGHDKTKPFFSLMWTYQTHYPYFFDGKQEEFSKDSVFNRYLNALKYGDQSLGKIIGYLKENDLFESTLLVVLGDHGEAFGQHDQITHASRIYEENIHIPFILINSLFKAEIRKETGGLVDLAPTITHLLELNTPSQWQGESMFEKKENSKAYFFSPWSEYLFGYREGKHKFIFNAANNESELYDLENDPHEKHNLFKEKKEISEHAHLKLAAWTQYVNNNFERLLSEK